METTEHKGSWWLPDNPDAPVTGSLRFENDGITLDLLGALTDPTGPRPQSVSLILGRSSEGKSITLYGCIQSNTIAGIEGVRESSFHVVGVLIGTHFQTTENLAFGKLTATFSQLEHWVGSHGVSVQSPTPDTLVLTKQSSFLVTGNVHDMKISIGFSFQEHMGGDEVSLKYVPFVSIELTKEIPLKKFLELLYHLTNFFALALRHPVHPESIDVYTEAVKVTLTNGNSFRRPIEIVYDNVNWGLPHDRANIRGMLFELHKVRTRFNSILNNWFDKAELLEPITGMYFGTLYNPNMYLQQKFLSLVQCVESYHRRVMHNLELPPEQGRKRVDDIVNSAPQEHKEWLRNKLRYSNELTLRKRLKELLESFSFVEFGNPGQFIEDVVNTRNYLTHYDEELKNLSANPTQMSLLSLKLTTLIEAILLIEIGLSLDEVKLITKRTNELHAEFRSFEF